MTGKRFALSVLLILSGFFAMSKTAYALELQDTKFRVSQNEEGDYTYLLADNCSFTTNVIEGQTLEMAYFVFDEDMTYDLMCNDELVDYTSEEIISDNGEYVLYVFPQEEDIVYGELSFTISNDGNTSNLKITDLTQMFESVMLEVEPESYYDKKNNTISYKVDDTTILYTNIPNGAVTTGVASVIPCEGTQISIKCDGEIIDLNDNGDYDAPGMYICELSSIIEAANNVKISHLTFTFRIIKTKTNAISVINTPQGYTICEASCNDMAVDNSGDYIFLRGEGYYHIVFQSLQDQGLKYTLNFTKDTIAPRVTFNKNIGRTVEPPISYQVSDPKAVVRVTVDNEEISAVDKTLYLGGVYTIVAVDEAGNHNEYAVFVRNVYSFDFKEAGIIFGVILVIVIGWIIYTRKTNYRVS